MAMMKMVQVEVMRKKETKKERDKEEKIRTCAKHTKESREVIVHRLLLSSIIHTHFTYSKRTKTAVVRVGEGRLRGMVNRH